MLTIEPSTVRFVTAADPIGPAEKPDNDSGGFPPGVRSWRAYMGTHGRGVRGLRAPGARSKRKEQAMRTPTFGFMIGQGMALAGGLALAAGCASTTLPLTASDRTPAAKGTVKTSTDAQGNTKLTVKVDYLPKPGDLSPDLTTFVVWSMADDAARVRNLGQLAIDKDRHGAVTLVSPLSRFRLLGTAEENGSAE